MNKFIRLNTIFIPDEALTRDALKIAAEISRGKEEVFHIDNKNCFAHLTIYSPEYPLRNLQTVLTAAGDIAARTRRIKLVFERFFAGWGYVGLEFKNTPEIVHLHEEMVRKLNPLREGYQREKYAAEIAEGRYPPEQVDYIKKYGYHNVFEFWRPHLTLARFADESVAEQVVEGLTRGMGIHDSIVAEIGVSEMGPNGTCTKIIKEFPLVNT